MRTWRLLLSAVLVLSLAAASPLEARKKTDEAKAEQKKKNKKEKKKDEAKTMVVAVVQDQALFTGAPEPAPAAGATPGTSRLRVFPVGEVSVSGNWLNLPCDPHHVGKKALPPKLCQKFSTEYLAKPHEYQVISAAGEGATVTSGAVRVDQCGIYFGRGSMSGAELHDTAIAAGKEVAFEHVDGWKPVPAESVKALMDEAIKLPPAKLDTTDHLEAFSLRLEGQDLVLLQRGFFQSGPGRSLRHKLIFGLGKMENGQLQVMFWKANVDEELEQPVGIIRLKSGREFLVTSVRAPEGQWFRIYGVVGGKVVLILSAGGASC